MSWRLPDNNGQKPTLWGRQTMSIHLFERCWDVVKRAEQTGELTVEEALDVATRLPQALLLRAGLV